MAARRHCADGSAPRSMEGPPMADTGRCPEECPHATGADPLSLMPAKRARDAGGDRQPEMLTVEQTIELTQLGRSTIYEALRTGDLPSVRIGRRILIPRQALRRRLALEEE